MCNFFCKQNSINPKCTSKFIMVQNLGMNIGYKPWLLLEVLPVTLGQGVNRGGLLVVLPTTDALSLSGHLISKLQLLPL